MIQEPLPGQAQVLPPPAALVLLGSGKLLGSDLEGERGKKMKNEERDGRAVNYSLRWVLTAH